MIEADKSKRPPECLEGQIVARDPDGIHCTWGDCPHLKEASINTDMEGETYDCAVCGLHYRLYYEDMQ